MSKMKIKNSFIGSTVAISFPFPIPTPQGPQFMAIQAKLIGQDEDSITVEIGTSEGKQEAQMDKDRFLFITKISEIKSAGLIPPGLLGNLKKQS